MGIETRADPIYVILRTRGRHPAWETPGGVEVRVADRVLPEHERRHGVAVFTLSSPPAEPFDLHLDSATIDPAQIGARSDGPRLGADVTAIELVQRPELAGTPTASLSQPISGPLAPETVWQRQGWYADFGWTDGEGILEGLRWSMPQDADRLVLELYPVHRHSKSPRRFGLRLEVDGLELEPVAYAPRQVVFRLPPVMDMIHTVRIRSATFVPGDEGRSDDTRTLGVPVRRLVPITAGAAEGRP
jgi:hypothetical protein